MTKRSFYVFAHADDWQLFMQPNAYKDIIDCNNEVIFIITTAGDAGMKKGYWTAREEGLKSSIRFCLAPFGALSQSNNIIEFNGHIINCWKINNVTCYFLRLPDGNLDGNGFTAYGFQSLTKLKSGNKLLTVDNSTNYQSWPDFYHTLQMIILHKKKDIIDISINYLNPDIAINSEDHADHIATGEAIQAMPIIASLQQQLYIGYSVGKVATQLYGADLFWKVGMFAVYEKTVFDQSGYSTLQEGIDTYIDWNLKCGQFITVMPQS